MRDPRTSDLFALLDKTTLRVIKMMLEAPSFTEHRQITVAETCIVQIERILRS